MKEKTNRWYSCLSYYMGRTLADAPFRIVFPIIYSILIYTLTGQVNEMNRLFLFSLINVSFAFMAQANGIFFSSIFINSISAAAVNGCVSLTPFLLLGGFIVSIRSMPPWAAWLSNFSYFRVTYLFFLSIRSAASVSFVISVLVHSHLISVCMITFLFFFFLSSSHLRLQQYTFEASASVLYGMDRCINAFNVTDESLSTPYNDLHQTLQANNLTYNSMFKLFKKYLIAQDLEEQLASDIITKVRAASNTTKEIFSQVTSDKYRARSFILDTFDIPEYYVWKPLAVLLAYFCLFRLFAYFILLYRSTPKK